MDFSFVIPVYNRPGEVDELLESLCRQTAGGFEAVVVEDGSSLTCKDVVDKYAGRIPVSYHYKENSGPGPSRNYGVERAKGRYAIILDSDVVLPDGYIDEVKAELSRKKADAFGGPDREHSSFTPVQKAISYSMTSFLTTGGIRGGKRKLDKFYPRSFNMGVERTAYARLGGFRDMRFGEDIDFSIRIFKAGLECRLFPGAWVWHKRRTDFRKFFKQVHNSGIARINLGRLHPGSLKAVHALPTVFTAGSALLAALAAATLSPWPLVPLAAYALVVFAHAALSHRSVRIAALSVVAAFVQLWGYGSGFIAAWWKMRVMGKAWYSAFEKTFYD